MYFHLKPPITQRKKKNLQFDMKYMIRVRTLWLEGLV